jgi:hypothetical protein
MAARVRESQLIYMFARRCRGESCASAWGQAKLGATIYTACAGKCGILGYSRQYRRVFAVGRERQTQDAALSPNRLHANVRPRPGRAGKISRHGSEERHPVAAAWQEEGRESGASPRANGTSLRSCRLGDANVAFNRKKAICPIEFPPIRHSDGLPAKLADAAPLRQAQARIVAQRRDLSTPA